MGFLRRLFSEPGSFADPIDTPIPPIITTPRAAMPMFPEKRDGTLASATWEGNIRAGNTGHKHYDGFGDPMHSWVEKRIQAIEATCAECGAVELHRDHPGRLKGQKMAKGLLGTQPNPGPAKLVVTPKGARRGSRAENAIRNAGWDAAYQGGLSVKAIADRAGVPESRVRDGLRSFGTKMRRYTAPPTEAPDSTRITEMVRLRVEEHLTYKEIGAQYGITRERVRQLLQRSGMDTHAVTEARTRATAKKYQPKPPSICRYCGTDFTGTPYSQHAHDYRKVANHNPHPRAAEFAARDKLVAADYAAGMKVNDIKAKYGVDAPNIMRAVDDCDVPRRRPNANFLKTMPEIKARKAAIVEDLKAGMRRPDIAAKYRVSEAWVSLVGKEAGIRTAKFTVPTDGERVKWVELWQTGVSVNAVARHFGRSQQAVSRHIKRSGATR